MDIVKSINEVLIHYSLASKAEIAAELPLIKKINEKVERNERLLFILPAFPAKSPSPHKTYSNRPDLGEVLALQNLQDLCDQITALYSPGAQIAICSDGRVFSDVVSVSDECIDLYGEGIKAIIAEYDLHSLYVLSMDDMYPDRTPDELRQLLLDVYAISLPEMKTLVSSDENSRRLFNGIHRFLLEDALELNPDRSKTSVREESKANAYELLRRSDAWSELLKEHFRDALRLSIHPHPLNNEKFGVKLVASSNKWATPWHNVTVKFKDRFELMHHHQALALNAVLKWEREKYAYFEVTET